MAEKPMKPIVKPKKVTAQVKQINLSKFPGTKGTAKVEKVMSEYKAGTLKSGKVGPGKGPTVKSKKQAIAIALSEQRKAEGKK